MTLTRGDIVIAVFPGELGKPRPAVILQRDELLGLFSTILCCPMTTHLIDAPTLRPIIVPSPENGLQEISQIMVEKLSPLRGDVIRQRIGRLTTAELKRLGHPSSNQKARFCWRYSGTILDRSRLRRREN